MEVLNNYFYFFSWLLDTAWIWLPFFLAVAFFQSWMYYIQRFYWQNLDWVMLEVKPPREIDKTPKNMEQIFAGMWGVFDPPGTKYRKYIKGMLQDYFSFEIVGSNGEIHFYLRVLRKFRDLVEAQVYSQYPQAEIKEVEDYAFNVPPDIPNKNWNLFGARLRLTNDGVYPLRTYVHLIDISKTEQPFLDPLAGLMEFMGKLRPGEQLWIQLVFRPIDDAWRMKAREMVDKLIGKAVAKTEGSLRFEARTWKESIGRVATEFITNKPADSEKKKETEEPRSLMLFLSPGEKDIVTGVEEKAAKKGYEAKIQFAYIARREVFSRSAVSATMGIFAQFANLNMNALAPDKKTLTKAYYAFAKMRIAYKQRVLMRLLRTRSFWERGYILNIEELATIYHFPTVSVQAPMTPYIPIKKGSPPVGLPVE